MDKFSLRLVERINMVGFVFKNTVFYQIFTATIRNDVIYMYTCTLIKNHQSQTGCERFE